MNVKEIFDQAENGVLTYDQFQQMAKDGNAKFTDLNEGNYVAKSKYESEIRARDTEIETLNGTIATRDADLLNLQTKLKDAGTDAQKLATVNNDLATLQGKYDTDTKALQEQLAKQKYEFAVKEFASSKKFTSSAAKRDFISSMIQKELKMENDKILGAEDFVNTYSADNADAFVVDTPSVEPPKAPVQNPPQFVNPTPGVPPTNANSGFQFNFNGVRKHE